jgi:hypothetical protein
VVVNHSPTYIASILYLRLAYLVLFELVRAQQAD